MSLANQLTNIAVWLENGCEPAMAAQELRKITNALWTPCLNEDGDAEMREHPDGAFVLLSDCSPPDMPTAAAPAGLSGCPHCREVYEIWANTEGFTPKTAPESYQQRIIEQMRAAAEKGL